MDQYELVVTLLSFIYALALTHVLHGAAQIILDRRRVVFSLPLALWMLLSVLILATSWNSLWDARDQTLTDAWIGRQFAFSILLYFWCVFVTPRTSPEGVIDMRAHHLDHVRLYSWTGALLGFTSALISLFVDPQTTTNLAGALLDQVWNLVVGLAMFLIGWFRSNHRVQVIGATAAALLGLAAFIFG